MTTGGRCLQHKNDLQERTSESIMDCLKGHKLQVPRPKHCTKKTVQDGAEEKKEENEELKDRVPELLLFP